MKGNHRVLLIDDDRDDQQFLQEALNELFPDIECISMSNGRMALDFIKTNPPPPRYIFLDLNMPFLNGFEFLKEFKKYRENCETTVYIYSTSSNLKDREKAKSLGADDYITKYSDFHSLKNKLKTVISA